MEFRVENHNIGSLFRLIKDIHKNLRGKLGFSWKIEYAPLPFPQFLTHPERVDIYLKSIQRGDIFAPVLFFENLVIDGRHRLEAVRRLNYKKVPLAYPLSPGEDVVDDVYFPLVKNLSPPPDRKVVYCLSCGTKMKKDVFWTCPCGRKFHSNDASEWTVINIKKT